MDTAVQTFVLVTAFYNVFFVVFYCYNAFVIVFIKRTWWWWWWWDYKSVAPQD